jgi:hypothetical protein
MFTRRRLTSSPRRRLVDAPRAPAAAGESRFSGAAVLVIGVVLLAGPPVG